MKRLVNAGGDVENELKPPKLIEKVYSKRVSNFLNELLDLEFWDRTKVTREAQTSDLPDRLIKFLAVTEADVTWCVRDPALQEKTLMIFRRAMEIAKEVKEVEQRRMILMTECVNLLVQPLQGKIKVYVLCMIGRMKDDGICFFGEFISYEEIGTVIVPNGNHVAYCCCQMKCNKMEPNISGSTGL